MLRQTPEDALRSQMDPGETLLWAGQPLQGIRFRSHDILAIPFSLLWGGFAIVWEAIAISSLFTDRGPDGPPDAILFLFPAFGIPFVLVGLYMIFGRFIVDARTRSRTFYGVTDQRIIILSGFFSQSIKSLSLATLAEISVSKRADGTGTITFGPGYPFFFWFGPMWWPGAKRSAPATLEFLQDVTAVYTIIRDAQKQKQ